MIKEIIKDVGVLELECQPIIDMKQASVIVKNLIDTAKHWQRRPIGCLGLAANQIGYQYNIIVIWHCGNYMSMINPVVLPYGSQRANKKEGCLSFPGISRLVARNKKIDVTYQIPKRVEPITVRFTGMTARVIQHECDHLMGRHI